MIVLASVAALYGANFEYSVDGQLVRADYGGKARISFAYDNSGNLLSATSPTKQELWRFDTFGTLDASGAAADLATNEGIPNLLRFALGVPLGETIDTRFGYVVDEDAALVEYWQRNDTPDLKLILEVSEDLVHWTPFSGTTSLASETTGYSLWRASIPLNKPRLFWRINTEMRK